jgi:transcriptional regulator with XRE-family HTH domain
MLRTMEPRRKRLEQPHPLRLWREKHGVNQRDLARACGISQGMLSLVESGLRIPLDDNLEALLNYTGLPAEAFVLPERFLKDHPDFLRKYKKRPKGPGGSESSEGS